MARELLKENFKQKTFQCSIFIERNWRYNFSNLYLVSICFNAFWHASEDDEQTGLAREPKSSLKIFQGKHAGTVQKN